MSEAGLHIRSYIEPIILTDKDGIDKNVIVDWPDKLDAQYTKAKEKLGKKLTPKFLKDLEKE